MNDMSIAKVGGAASGRAESPVGSNDIELRIGALQMTPGVVAARASAFTNVVYVEHLSDRTAFAVIRPAIESAGYRVTGKGEAEGQRTEVDALDPEQAAREAEFRLFMRKFRFAAEIVRQFHSRDWWRWRPGRGARR
jgi:hypothetical protein